jgi:hypothetical protein
MIWGCSSRILIFIHLGSRIHGSKRHRILDPDLQLCYHEFHHSSPVWLQEDKTVKPLLDLAFKDGETIKVNINVPKRDKTKPAR